MEPTTPLEPAGTNAFASRTNWAGNYAYGASEFAESGSEAALRKSLASTKAAKAVGSRHSFNHIADTSGTQISTSLLKAMTLDVATCTVTIGAGVTYGELAPFLDREGFALQNLASLPHISVAGACSTGTHGSGLENGCLSTAVRAVNIVRADGACITLSRESDPEVFPYAVINLGALGVITTMTLEVVPAFRVAQTVFENLSLDVLEKQLPEVFGPAYSVSLFTDWQHHRAAQVWVKERVGSSLELASCATFFDATRQKAKLHPLPGVSAESCTEQEGIAGSWFERLPHFRLDYTPSAGAELQSEYFVDLSDGYSAICAVEELRDRIAPHLLVSELRTIAPDELPLSMCCGRRSLALHFTWKQETEAVTALLPAIEEKLKPFGARPHWAKLFTFEPAYIRAAYPRFDRFKQVMGEFDPEGKFRNPYLRELFGVAGELQED